MDEICNPTYGLVDDLLELLTKSKALHILLELDRASHPLRFTDLKQRVGAASTTVSRRLRELEQHRLTDRVSKSSGAGETQLYTLSEDAKMLSPIMQSLYDWVEARGALALS